MIATQIQRTERIKPQLSIVIPAYNEAEIIFDTINEIKKDFANISISYEIIVVDDGSTDNTRILASEAGALVIRKNVNKGKASAVVTGIQEAKGQVILTLDANGAVDPNMLSNMIQPILNDETDVVFGVRLYEKLEYYPAGILNKFTNLFFSRLIRLLFRKKIRDPLTSVRAFNKIVLDFLRLTELPTDISFDTELNLRILSGNLRFIEIPIWCRLRVSYLYSLQSYTHGFSIITSILKTFFMGGVSL